MDLLSNFFNLISSTFVFVIGSIVMAYLLYPIATWTSKILQKFMKIKEATIWNISCLVTACIFVVTVLVVMKFVFSYISTLMISISYFLANNSIEEKLIEFSDPIFKRFNLEPKIALNYIKSNFAPSQKYNSIHLELLHSGLIGILVFVASIHIIRDWFKWQKRIVSLEVIFPNQAKRIDAFCSNFSESIKKWIVGQIIVAFILSVYYAVSFFLIRLSNSIVLGFIFGFSCFIPYFGDLISIIAVAYTLISSTNILILVIGIVLISIVGHVIGSHVLTPWIIGSHTGLHPLQIILGFIIYSKMFGVWGIILNIPISLFFNAIFRSVLINKDNEETLD